MLGKPKVLKKFPTGSFGASVKWRSAAWVLVNFSRGPVATQRIPIDGLTSEVYTSNSSRIPNVVEWTCFENDEVCAGPWSQATGVTEPEPVCGTACGCAKRIHGMAVLHQIEDLDNLVWDDPVGAQHSVEIGQLLLVGEIGPFRVRWYSKSGFPYVSLLLV